ncbi:hypothetical protein HK405_014251, partial [Cladochytrium tenue]
GTLDEAIQRKLERKSRNRAAKEAAPSRSFQGDSELEDDDEDDAEVDGDGDSDDYVQPVSHKRKPGRPPRGKRKGLRTPAPPPKKADSVDGLSTPTAHSTKRRKVGEQPEPEVSQVQRAIDSVLNAVRECSITLDDGSSRPLAEEFEDLPSRRRFKEYYRVVSRPVSLSMIGARADAGGYAGLDEFRDDFATMIANAKLWNGDGASDAARDTLELERVFNEAMALATAAEPTTEVAEAGNTTLTNGSGGDGTVAGHTATPKIHLKIRATAPAEGVDGGGDGDSEGRP